MFYLILFFQDLTIFNYSTLGFHVDHRTEILLELQDALIFRILISYTCQPPRLTIVFCWTKVYLRSTSTFLS